MAHILHDIRGNISASIFNHYINISAHLRRWVLLDDAISSGHISRRFSRRCLSAVAVVCCCFVVVVMRFYGYIFISMSHKVYYVNYRRFSAVFWAVSARPCTPIANGSPPEISLPHHPVVPAWNSLGSPRHRAHQKKLPHTPTLILKGWYTQKIYAIFYKPYELYKLYKSNKIKRNYNVFHCQMIIDNILAYGKESARECC